MRAASLIDTALDRMALREAFSRSNAETNLSEYMEQVGTTIGKWFAEMKPWESEAIPIDCMEQLGAIGGNWFAEMTWEPEELPID